MLRRKLSTSIFPLSLSTARVPMTCSARSFREQPAAHRPVGKLSHSHPLAPRNPAYRNIAIPDTVHSSRKSKAMTSADVRAKRASKALMHHMNQELLWQGTVINDINTETVQHFVRLRNDARYRNKRKRFSMQGQRLLEEIADRGYHPRTLMIRKDNAVPTWVDPERTEVVRVSDRVMHKVAQEGDGYIGDYDVPYVPHISEIVGSPSRLSSVLVLDNVADEGLLGTFLRSAVAFAYDVVILTNHCADLYSHGVVRAAQGAHFQDTTKVYVLREEDGDDVSGIINYLQQRNRLTGCVYSPTFSTYHSAALALPPLSGSSGSNSESASTKLDESTKKATGVGDDESPQLVSVLQQRVESTGTGSTATHHVFAEASSQFDECYAEDVKQVRVQPFHSFCLDSYTKYSKAKANEKECLAQQLLTAMEDDGLPQDTPAGAGSRRGTEGIHPGGGVGGVRLEAETAHPRSTGTGISDEGEGEADDDEPFPQFIPGHLLVAGPDHRGNLVGRYQRTMVRKPTVLLADMDIEEAKQALEQGESSSLALTMYDDSQQSLELALPNMMYELRHSAAFDYLTAEERENPSYHEELTTAQGKSDYGGLGDDDLDLDDDDLYARDMKALEMVKRKRLAKRLRNDEDTFIMHEEKRIKRMAMREGARVGAPMFNQMAEGDEDIPFSKAETKYPDVPHFIRDANPEDLLDRDTLRKDRDQWATYQRTDAYSARERPSDRMGGSL